MSHGWPREISWIAANTSSGRRQRANSSAHPHASPTRRRIEKSASAEPGARRTFRRSPIRRSELMKVPSFSPHPAAGRTMSASRAVSVVAYRSCTTSTSSFRSVSRASLWWIHEWAPFVAITQSARIRPARISARIWS